ncbi:MAG: hypothetical protein FJ291_03535 [Planctomycetes bacterium]|nr:hypothetical protein [Planctomycetota bacterium]
MGRKTSLFALVLAVAAMECVGGEAGEPTAIERLLPADAIAVAQARDMKALGAAFEQSALADAIKGSQLLRYFRTAAGAVVELGATILSGLPGDELGACLGSNAAVALLDFKDATDLRQRVPVVLLIEAADSKKLETTLLAQLQILSLLGATVGSADRAGATIHELSLPNGAVLAFAFREGVFIAGGREGVNALLASLGGEGPRLAASPGYQAARNALPLVGGISLYVNARSLIERSGLAADPARLKPLQAIGLANAAAAGIALDFQGRQLRERVFVKLEGPPTGLLRLLTEGQPVASASAHFIPQGYTALLSMSLRDVGLWDRFRAFLQEVQGPAAADGVDTVGNEIQKQFGVHPKAGIFDTFGDEAFLALDLSKLAAFHGSGRTPKPQEFPIIFGAKLRDAATLKATADRIAANQLLYDKGIQRTTIEHQGAAVWAFRTPLSPELRPSIAILDDLFLFSLRPEPLTAALDARKAGKPFAAGAPAAAPAHLTLQANDAQLLASLLACVRNDLPEGAKRLLPEADKIIASLHGYRAVLRREPQGIIFEACSDIGTAGTILAAAPMLDQGNAIIARRVNADFDQLGGALEAYRAKNGHYPETLDQLVPDFLPNPVNDRFVPERPYGYSRGQPGPDGKPPDAWLITSVGPDHHPNIPVEQFDPPVWAARLKSQDPEEIALLKRVIYRFQPERYPDERKNDDEGDLYRMGGKGLAAQPSTPPPPKKAGAPKEDF